LNAILGQEDARAASLRTELAALASPARPPRTPPASSLLAWAVAVVRADGEIEERERRALQRLGKRLGASEERIEALLADGVPASAERVFLRDAAVKLRMPRVELVLALRATRTALYRETRRAAR